MIDWHSIPIDVMLLSILSLNEMHNRIYRTKIIVMGLVVKWEWKIGMNIIMNLSWHESHQIVFVIPWKYLKSGNGTPALGRSDDLYMTTHIHIVGPQCFIIPIIWIYPMKGLHVLTQKWSFWNRKYRSQRPDLIKLEKKSCGTHTKPNMNDFWSVVS